MTKLYGELNPPPRILMGPGPVGVDPRVLRAMSMPMLGQFDPAFTAYMNEMMELLRQVFRTRNRWSFLVDGTARAGVEAILVSLIVSFTLTPMLSSRLLKRNRDRKEADGAGVHRHPAFFRWIDLGYGRLLEWSLNHRALVILVAVGTFALTFVLNGRVGRDCCILPGRRCGW